MRDSDGHLLRAVTLRQALLLLLFAALCAAGCERGGPANEDPLQIGTETLEFEMKQRATTTVPGVMGRISLRLGDVESARGAEDVEVIDHKDESAVASSRLMRKGAALDFEIDDAPYTLQLVEYDAAHVLNDTATFTLRRER